MSQTITVTSLRDVSALIAEHVMKEEVYEDLGFVNSEGVTPYARVISDAWDLAERLMRDNSDRKLNFTIGSDKLGYEAEFHVELFSWGIATAQTAPLAICLAALQCVGIEVDLQIA